MRETRLSGSEGGARFIPRPYPYVRLGACLNRRVQVPLWRSFPPATESNCEPAMPRGEQPTVNDSP